MLAGLWILLSDRVLYWIEQEAEGMAWLQSLKGLGFVVVTSFLLYLAVRAYSRRRDRLEARALESEVNYRFLYESAPVPYQTLDESGVILEANPAWSGQLGYGQEEIIGQRFESFVATEDRERFRELHKRVRIQGTVADMQLRLRHVDGDCVPFSLQACTGILSTDMGMRTLWVFRDLSGVEEANRRLESAVAKLEEIRIKQERTNDLMVAMRELNKLITRQKEPPALIRETCEILVRDWGVPFAWIALYGSDGRLLDHAEFGLESEKSLFRAALEDARHLPFLRGAHQSAGMYVALNPEKSWSPSPFLENYAGKAALCMALVHGEREYGYFGVAVPREAAENPDEIELFREVGNDIGYALYNIQNERAEAHHQNELRIAKEEAESGDRAKTEFLRMMSHEMRTPLNPIMGLCELMLDQTGDAREREYLKTMMSCSQKMVDLVENILEYIELDTESVNAVWEDFEPVDMCQSCLKKAAERGRHLDLRFENGRRPNWAGALPPNLLAHGERRMLARVLDHLLDNAVKYTPSGYVILRVTMEERKRDLSGTDKDQATFRFEVEDTGIGIGHTVRERIFERFTQADATLARQYEGIGLGLAVCRKLVAILGGTIDVRSELGMGSCFMVEVPMGVSGPGEPAKARAPKSRVFSRPLDILIVEDDPNSAMVSKFFVEQAGGNAVVASGGFQAVYLANQKRFDAILMDISMPDKDGFETWAEIASLDGPNSGTRIIAVTAHADREMEVRCKEAGFHEFVSKPIRSEALVRLLQDLC